MANNSWGNAAKILFMLKALLELIFGGLFGVFIAPFLKEKVRLNYRGQINQTIVDKCPALHSFASAPWAPSYISQTVLGTILQVGSPEYQRREVVVAPDGVELLLDFKEAPDTPEDAPLMMILHGIGGNSESRLARLLADACVAQGWRACVYNRRGHGQSTILPAPLVPPKRPPQTRQAKSERVSYRVEKAAQTVASGFVDLPRQVTKATRVVRKATRRSFVGEDGRPSHLSALGAFFVRASSTVSAPVSKQATQDTNQIETTASHQQTRRSAPHDVVPPPHESVPRPHSVVHVVREDGHVVREHDHVVREQEPCDGQEGAGTKEGEGGEVESQRVKGAHTQEEEDEWACTQGCLWGLVGAERKAQQYVGNGGAVRKGQRCEGNGSLRESGLHATLPYAARAATQHSSVQSVDGSHADAGSDAAGALSVHASEAGANGAHGVHAHRGAAGGVDGACSVRAGEAGLPMSMELPLPPQAPVPPQASPPPQPSPPAPTHAPEPTQQQQQQQQEGLRSSLESPQRTLAPGSVAVDVSQLGDADSGSGRSSGHESEGGGGSDSDTDSPPSSKAARGGVTGSSVTIDIKARAEDSVQTAGPADPCTRSFSLKQVGKVFPAHSNHDDLAVVSAYLAQKYPDAVRLILGFSQGSNLLVHYLGVYASSPPPFAAALCVSNAFDLVKATMLLKKRPLANAIMAHEIRSLLVKEEAAVRELCSARGINADIEKALRCPCIREFDQALLCPAYGFDHVDEYYRHQSSGRVLKDIVTPLLCLNNDDDPFISDKIPDAPAHAALHGPLPNVIAARTKRGGHLGWLQGWRGESWMTDVMLQYSKAVLELVDKGVLPRVPEPGPEQSVSS